MIHSILFNGIIKSSGIVNFDHNDSRFTLRKAKPDYSSMLSRKNVKIAKHAYIQEEDVDENGKPIIKAILKISKDCIRNAIFLPDQPSHNPGIMHLPEPFIKHLSSNASLLRGYMFASASVKRKSPVYLSDAIQISNNISSIDIGTLNAPKDQKETTEDTSGLTLHFKESISGIVSYEFEGAIDMDNLQFISLSEVYDRKAIDPNYLDSYIKNLEINLGGPCNNKNFYLKKTASNSLPEEGLLLTQQQIKNVIKFFFMRLLNMEINRGASGRAWLDSLSIRLKERGLDQPRSIPVSSEKEIDIILKDFEAQIFYDYFDEEEALSLYSKIDTGKKKESKKKEEKKINKEKK